MSSLIIMDEKEIDQDTKLELKTILTQTFALFQENVPEVNEFPSYVQVDVIRVDSVIIKIFSKFLAMHFFVSKYNKSIKSF